MAVCRELARPPIKEALINIEIAPEKPPEFAEQLDAAWANCGKKQRIQRGRFQFQVGNPLSSTGSHELIGVRCDSEDGRSVAQVRRDGITLSILRDYKDWTELEAQTVEVWHRFIKLAGPVTVTKIATKFINILRLPTGNIEFNDYFTAAPRVPPALPQIMGEFFQRITVPLKPDTIAIVIQALDAPTPDALSMILDIDVQLSCVARSDISEIRPLINSLRRIKNDVFFSSVTEKALEAY